MEVDRNGLEILDRGECLRLLSLSTLGRIAITSGALPVVLPVSFHLDGERILVRARRRSRLGDALRNAVVAFEVDDLDVSAHAGWSVAVTGVAAEVRSPSQLDSVRGEPADRWTSSPGDSLVAISTEHLTGRRITARSRPTRA
jgi:nitroimidazol reductase NimA-like FMN-containing flavoprotein (pyridoxamine 5'-phosphate oxidase superfamily)